MGTRLVTNSQDTNSYEQATLPFGTALDAESTGATNRRFTSYDRSAVTGLDYANNRQYDSLQGRFTQVDPIGMEASSLIDPQSLNMYSYVGNDPVNYTDPDGLFFGKLFKWIGRVVKAIIAVAAVVAIFVGVLATAGALAPVAGVSFGLKLFAAAAIGLAGAFGPPWLRKAVSIASLAFGALSGAGIFGFAEGGGLSWGGVATAFGILNGVGAVANHLQRRQRRGDQRRKPVDRGRIAAIAAANIGEGAWRTSRARTRNGKTFPEGSNKCNQFVYDVLVKAGAPAPTSGGGGQWPAQAGEWGDPSVQNLQGWEIVEGGYVARQPGDVISQAHGQGATGHVAIIGPNRETIGTGINDGVISSTDWGGRLGQGNWGGIVTGQSTKPVVVRRCKQ